MPRNRTARSAVLGLAVRRPAPRPFPSRSRSAAPAPRRAGDPGPALACPDHGLVPRAPGRAAARRAGRRRRRAAAVRGRGRARRAAVPRTPTAGRRISSTRAPRTSELRAENEQLQQQVIQNESALQENVRAQEPARLPQRARVPAGLRRRRRRGDRPAVARVRPDDRRLRRLQRRRRRGRAGRHRRRARRHGHERDARRGARAPAHRRVERRLRARPADERGRDRPSTASPATRSSSTGSRRRRSCSAGDEIITAGWRSGRARLALPEGDHDRPRHVRRPAQHRPLPAGAGRLGRRLLVRSTRCSCSSPADRCRSCRSERQPRRRRDRLRRRAPAGDALRVPRRRAAVPPTCSCSRCSRSRSSAAPSPGAVAGFFGGLLVDIVTLDTLGVTALLYALAGYWTGRYGETTGRDRAHAPLLAVLVFTVAIAFAGFGLHFLLGEEVSARRALFETLLPSVALNLILGGAVFALCRAVLRRATPDRSRDRGAAPWLARSPSAARPRGGSCRPTRGRPSRTASRRSSRCASACSPRSRSPSSRSSSSGSGRCRSSRGDRYLNAAQSNQLRTVPVEAPRGSILDRAGRTIVSNVPGTAVQIWTADLPEGGPLRDVQAALEDPARAAAAADEGARGGQGRPADADPRQDGRARGPGDGT